MLRKFTNSCDSRQICGHSFSEEAIRQSFRGSTSVAKKCPTSGCNKSFKLTDLKPDPALAKKVKNWNRRNQRAAEDVDAEEIVE
jgi:SUMO ligase MMS21 Smc5/6 complex component